MILQIGISERSTSFISFFKEFYFVTFFLKGFMKIYMMTDKT